MPVCSSAFYLPVPCCSQFSILWKCKQANSVFVSTVTVGYYTSLAHSDIVTCINVFPHVRHRMTTPTTGSIFVKMADCCNSATFEPNYLVEFAHIDNFGYFCM